MINLNWEEMCYEEVLSQHPDRLADRLADFLGSKLEIEPRFFNYDNHCKINVRYSIDVVLCDDTVYIFAELNYNHQSKKAIEEFLTERCKEFFYKEPFLYKCLGKEISQIKFNIILKEQSKSLSLKERDQSNDNCIINYYESDKLQEIRDIFEIVAKYLQDKQWENKIMRDGKMILKWDNEKNKWCCYITICYNIELLKGQADDRMNDDKKYNEIILTNEKVVSEFNHKKCYLIVVNDQIKDFWFTPASFRSDIGITGRKLQSDFFYGLAPHQQGSIHGKDKSKYDRFRYEELEKKNRIIANKENFYSETWLCNGKKPISEISIHN